MACKDKATHILQCWHFITTTLRVELTLIMDILSPQQPYCLVMLPHHPPHTVGSISHCLFQLLLP